MYPSACLRRQAGFLLPLSMFILVGMAALALAMSRLSSNTLTAAVQEAIAAQALNSADSGAQLGLHKLLFDAQLQSEVDTRCATLQGNELSFSAVGLTGCQVRLQCEVRQGAVGGRHVYALISAARCGGGQLTAERSVSVATYFD